MAGRSTGPLCGIPIGLKDIVDTKGIPTTCHSKILRDNVPDTDATCAVKLAEAGTVLMGKTATHEFADGGPSFDLPWPPARNPWNTAHFTAGSSSGTGAGIAAGLFMGGIGTDTGGSIRGPAALCGIAGIKPTYGLVSRAGVAPAAFTLDHIGPMAWTAEDCALMLQALAGHDPRDPASASRPIPDYAAGLGTGIKGMRIGVIHHFHEMDHKVSDGTQRGIDAAIATLRGLGAEISEVTLSPLAEWHACGTLISITERAAAYEEWARTRLGDFGARVQQRLLIGALVSGVDYVQAVRAAARAARRTEGGDGGARCGADRGAADRGAEDRRGPRVGRRSEAKLHHAVQRRGLSGDVDLLGIRRRRSAGGDPARRQTVPGGDGAAGRPTRSRRRPRFATAVPRYSRRWSQPNRSNAMAQHQLRASPETVRIGVFDATFPPVMTIESGDRVVVQCVSGRNEVMPPASAGLAVPPELSAIIAANPAMRAGHIVTGPIAVAGAEPGDMLEIRIEKIEPGADWGYNMIRPLAGTLPEDFHEMVLSHIPVDRARGVCSAAVGHGACAGAVLRRDGGGAAAGVRHHRLEGAAHPWRQHGQQGTGRRQHAVSAGVGTGGELLGRRRPRRAGRRRGLRHRAGDVPDRNLHLRAAQGRRRSRPLLRQPKAETPTHFISMGLNEDLDQAMKQALREMIAFICSRSNLSREQAYQFCSLAVDFHVTQTVNGEKGIHGMLKKGLLF